jgi:hypothetical protein
MATIASQAQRGADAKVPESTPSGTGTALPKPRITCPKYVASAGRRCDHYLDGGPCSRPDEFMCVVWLEANGYRAATAAPASATPLNLATPTTSAPAVTPPPPRPPSPSPSRAPLASPVSPPKAAAVRRHPAQTELFPNLRSFR